MNIHLHEAYSFCQLGRRANQEDSRWPDTDAPNKAQRFFVVCDGVGGNERGEVASRTVCEAVAKSLGGVDLANETFTEDDFAHVLYDAYAALDSRADDGNRRMATTLAFVCFHRGGCMMAHIGDSRIYQVRPGAGIVYRSEDHSLVNELVRAGVITPEQAVYHPQRNVILRAMSPTKPGIEQCQATVTCTKDVRAGDLFLLCSDGVLHGFSDSGIVALLDEATDTKAKVRKMAGGCAASPDNNTAILVEVESVEADGVATGPAAKGSRTTPLPRPQYTTRDVAAAKRPDKGLWARIKGKFSNQ